MKTAFIALLVSGTVWLTAASLQAEGTNSTVRPSQPHEYHLLPPKMVEKLNLTDEQKDKLQSLEEKFGKTYQEYRTAHKDEIEAAQKDIDKALAELQEKRKDLEQVMAGLLEQRKAAMDEFRAVLTEEQRKHFPYLNGTPAPPSPHGTSPSKSTN